MKTKLLLLLLLTNFSIYAQTNLVPNGGFENWTDNTTLPSWTTLNNVAQNTAEYWEGFNSIKLSFASSTLIPKITTQVPLNAGVTYVVKFKYKYLSSNYNSSHPIVLNISKNGSSTTLSKSFFATDNNWATVETTFTPDQNLSYDLNISLNTLDNIGFNANIDYVQIYAKGTEQYTLIPDLNFEKKLIALGHDSGPTDGKVLTANISTLTSLNITANSNGVGLVKDLTGIQDFTALTLLNCEGQQLTTLDLTKNTALATLNCQNNLLTNLNISKNSSLTTIICNNNKLTNLDVSEKLALTNLQCTSNKLISLDVLKNTALITLLCDKNSLTSLDISKLIALVTLDCSTNLLTSLDASKNIALTSLYCTDNPLTNVNVKNGNNKAFYWNSIYHLSFSGNKDLKCITVDDIVYSNKNWTGNKESGATYALACDGRYTAIPDPRFHLELINLGLDSGNFSGKVLTANISSLKTLDLSSKNITDLTGIEDFTELTSLDCSKNKLSSIDISKNIALTTLNCSYNYTIDFLDVSKNINLKILSCHSLKIRDLNLKNNLKLTLLNCSYNALTNLEIPHNPDFNYLDCSNNRLAQIDVSKNTNLTYFDCSNNKLTNLDVSNNGSLITFYCNSNNLFNLNVKNGNNLKLSKRSFIDNPNLTCINVDSYSTSSWGPSKDPKAFYNSNCSGENIPYTLIPDPAFEQKLIDIGVDTDGKNGKVITTNIASLKSLDVSSSNITNLTGIEDFTSLTYLDCGSNKISNLDLTQNTVLTTLFCPKNDLEGLNLYKNTFLTYLDCNTNRLKGLNVYYLTALTYLNVSNNSLSNLNLFYNNALTNLNCSYNKLTTLDITRNLALTTFNCSNNILRTLNVDKNSALVTFICNNNKLENLEVTKNLALATFICNNNKLAFLDVTKNVILNKFDCQYNNLRYLNLKNGNNKNFDLTDSNFTNNTLTCISVDDENYSNANWSNLKDAYVSFYENCDILYTLIPDINFENKLIALKIDSGIPDGKIATSKINFITYLNLNGSSISDLTGIQDFTALTQLNFQNNQVTAIDISKNIALTELHANTNKLTTLDTSNNLALTELNISSNKLTSINISKNINLTYLFCGSNQLTALNVSNNKKLSKLSCSSNQLTNLDLSQNTGLSEINCENNNLSTLNLKNGNNKSITNNYLTLDFTQNPLLKCIQVDDENYSNTNWGDRKDVKASFNTDCSAYTLIPDSNFEDKLIALGIDKDGKNGKVATASIVTIKSLNVSNSEIKNLKGIEDFVSLTSLNCSNNQLSELSIANNISLNNLNCSTNTILELELSKNTELVTLSASFNQLENLNVSKNTKLKEIDCAGNNLFNLNLKNGNNVNMQRVIFGNFTQNPNLLCILVDDAAFSNQNWIAKDATASYSSEACAENIQYTLIPDPNFEKHLISLGIDSGTVDGKVLTSNVKNITSLSAFGSPDKITDLTGIEDFVSLESLYCYKQAIIKLNLSKNQKLKLLDINNNKVSILDLSKNTALETVNCGFNNLTELNVSNNKALKSLHINNNQITNVDVSQNPTLEDLEVGSNQLITIDVTTNLALKKLSIYGNKIKAVNTSKNPDLIALTAFLTELKDVDVSQNKALTYLNVKNCQLTAIDVSKNKALYGLEVSENKIETIDVSQNPLLTTLTVNSNQLTSLNLKNGKNTLLNNNYVSFTSNPKLYCILVDDVTYANTNWPYNKDAIATYNTECTGELILPANNFAVETKAESCLGENNGEINIVAKTSFAYTATINSKSYSFTNNILKVANLTPGVYKIKITIPGQIFEQNFNVTIAKGATISGKSNITARKVDVEITEGTAPYTVFVDGTEQFQTNDSAFSVDVTRNALVEVATAKACEGIFAKKVSVSDFESSSLSSYPNPTSGSFEIEITSNKKEIKIEIYNLGGQLVSAKTYPIESGKAQLNLENQASGIYITKIYLDTPEYIKIIKK
ncbi:T9SS type A sorting domain-containing protein [Flavobacterium sp. 140616W15]|uniref:T9SS type A sorting domain-containing protein n=1 Tax=Flavobacterium sp. 140616W15 TaxID=2478552 RepID=UPI000F0C6145|nr:T9SS type A sorting domain-containing protein [Flavobacterium sp. 140616W15]AYN05666.1 T9SS C-terminal target domain-containing protein [Flavobacterium sp. 140616W15]